MIRFFLLLLLLLINCRSFSIVELIEDYQKEETQYNGDRCKLYPTCSEYAKIELKENLILGFFLTWERLFIREQGDLTKKFLPLKNIRIPSGKIRFYDPPHNSFKKPSFLSEDF